MKISLEDSEKCKGGGTQPCPFDLCYKCWRYNRDAKQKKYDGWIGFNDSEQSCPMFMEIPQVIR